MRRLSARDDRASVITLVNVDVVIACAGRVGTTDDNTGFEAGPISRCPGQSKNKRVAVYALHARAFVR